MTTPRPRPDGGASVPADTAADAADERAWATAAGEGAVPATAPDAQHTRSDAPAERDPDAVVVPREMPAATGPSVPRHERMPDPVASRQTELGSPVENPLGDLDREPAVFPYPPGRGLPGSPTPSRSVHGPITAEAGLDTGRPAPAEAGPAGRAISTETRGDPESDDSASGATGGAAAGAAAGAIAGGPIGMIPGAVIGAAAGMAAEGVDSDDEPGHEVDDRGEGTAGP